MKLFSFDKKNSNRDSDILFSALRQYNEDHDIEKAIATYEEIIVKNKSKSVSGSDCMMLVTMYIRNGQNNEAWGLMNRLVSEYPSLEWDISLRRFEILTSEHRHLEDALFDLASGYLLMAKNDNKHSFAENEFDINAKPVAEELMWTKDTYSRFLKLVNSYAKKKNYDLFDMRDKYKEFLTSVQKVEEKKEETPKVVVKKIPKFDEEARVQMRSYLKAHKQDIADLAESKATSFDLEMTGLDYYKQGDTENALIYLYAAAKKKGDMPAIYETAGAILHKLGMFKEESAIAKTGLKYIKKGTSHYSKLSEMAAKADAIVEIGG